MDKIFKPQQIYCLKSALWVFTLILLSITLPGLHPPLLAQDTNPMPDRHDMPDRQGMPDRHDSPRAPDRSDVFITQGKTANTTGSWLELQIVGVNTMYWTEVEWVDGDGAWHIVEGWRGYSKNGIVRWFVQEDDLAKGPFRWRVFKDQEDLLIINSQAFSLPVSLGTTVNVRVQTE